MITLDETPVNLASVAGSFPLFGDFRGGAPYGNGHINDTYAVTFDQSGTAVRYILQRINDRVFQDVPALMENIHRVTAHVARGMAARHPHDTGRRVLTLVPSRDGRAYHRDESGGWWRCYLFIEKARTFDIVATPREAASAARAFGEFQGLLIDLPGPRLHETIRDFHHARRRFERLQGAIEADSQNRAAGIRDEIDFALQQEPMVNRLVDLHHRGEIPERITHNDTKFNNVMIDDSSHEGVCVIDLDTVMPGLSLYDFGDLVRSATNSAAEDEEDWTKVSARLSVFEALVDGYLETAGDFLNKAELAHLAFAGQLMTFEVGIRFLTDYLEGDVYFKSQRALQNLDRARVQFALVRSLQAQHSAMEAIVRRKVRL
jgi:hypothetical protein